MTIQPKGMRRDQVDRRRSALSGAVLAALFLGMALASGCGIAVTPEQAAEGALRARLNAEVAPAAYRSGVLPPELAEVWRSRAASDVGPWFGEGLRLAQVDWIQTLTANLMEQPGPIVTSVEIRRVEIPPATIEGDSARISGAAIEYTTHYAPGSWNEVDVDGGTMCIFDLRRIDARWVVEERTCNVSGG